MEEKSHALFIEKKRAWYKTLGKVYCPALKQEVTFNSKGFNHLLFDGFGRKRAPKEAVSRLNILPLSVDLIKNIQTISEYRSLTNLEYWKLKMSFYEKSLKVTVILKKAGSGKISFHSTWSDKISAKKPD